VLLLLLDRFLFLRRVLRLLLALLRGLMGHGSLLWSARTTAPRQYRPKSGGAQGWKVRGGLHNGISRSANLRFVPIVDCENCRCPSTYSST
jgi:hypothetical protein